MSKDEAIDRAYAATIQRAQVPLARVGRVEEVADLAAFLASSQSAYITGQAININGGVLLAAWQPWHYDRIWHSHHGRFPAGFRLPSSVGHRVTGLDFL
ncbi:MAG: SDR family oxidoreductase [Chloroflexi bacterium]|nr:SDR family oxidoreductase [Chloroflexota bacterium]